MKKDKNMKYYLRKSTIGLISVGFAFMILVTSDVSADLNTSNSYLNHCLLQNPNSRKDYMDGLEAGYRDGFFGELYPENTQSWPSAYREGYIDSYGV
ncbi:TPA: YSIRK-type signal peptide-containing protein, partial [Streptococcus equi subsp. zooepidemicus]|nr:YSIRK-type signal peptide-containing protein [Streptococcus equi subsp. zooepidemicus]